MASTRGRRVEVPLTNKSGGSVAAGDVVVIDTANDDSFTTTTAGRTEVSVGIAQETIANNAVGRVLISGEAALVNVPASVTRGHYLETHTVAKQATGNSTRRSGSFGQFKTGGTTPKAWLWGSTDPAGSSGVTAVAAGTVDGDGSGDVTTTTSANFVDLTGASITITTGARRVLLGFTCGTSNSGSNVNRFTFSVDGTDQGSAFGYALDQANAANIVHNVAMTFMTAALSAGSHTFKVRWRVSGGTGTVKNLTAGNIWTFWAMELPT